MTCQLSNKVQAVFMTTIDRAFDMVHNLKYFVSFVSSSDKHINHE